MQIEDVFRLPPGRTALVGYISGPPVSLRGRECDLVIDGRVTQTLKLESEMIPRRTDPAAAAGPRLRSVSTLDDVRLDSATVRAHRCWLVGRAD